MKKRFYFHCTRCRKRMRLFKKMLPTDYANNRYFYFCPHCGYAMTFNLHRNLHADGWPQDVSAEAVRAHVYGEDGRLLPEPDWRL